MYNRYMDLALIGLPQSGKTTLFNALTAGHGAAATGGPGRSTRVGVVKVPDPRALVLAEMYFPRKIVYPEIRYWDWAGQDEGGNAFDIGGRVRNTLQAADAFLLVVRAFSNPSVHHPYGSVDPGRDLRAVLGELMLADMEVLERAVERQQDGFKKSKPVERPQLERQLEATIKVKEGVEAGEPLRCQTLTESEAALVRDYQLLTAKPVIVAFNGDENALPTRLEQLGLYPEEITGLGEVSVCAGVEADLAEMDTEEEEEFRREMGLGEPATSQVIRTCYDTLGLVSFLTVGDDEVRAWSIPEGLPAQQAAATIHTDFYRGFVRAEVIPYNDLVRCGGIPQGRKEGVVRSEGKTYPVQDGDVINFLVNV